MKEKKAITATIIFMIISIIVYWFINFIGIKSNVAYGSILLLPILVYSILADKITSFKAGNIEATFKEIANKKISTGKDSIEELTNDDGIDIIAKGSTNMLSQRVLDLRERTSNGNKIILTLILGKEDYYTRKVVLKHLKSLFAFNNFTFIVFLNKDKKVEAFISKEKLSALLEAESIGREFVNALNNGDIANLKLYPGIIFRKLKESTKNIDALKEMEAHKLEELIVVDEKNELKAVIQRGDILSKMMIALAE